MIPNPFHRFPSRHILKRASLLSLPLVLLGYLLVGSLSLSETLILNERFLGRDDAQDFSKRSQIMRATLFYSRWVHDGIRPPEGCAWTSPSPSEFRQKQCREFWGVYGARTVTAAIPFLLWGIVVGLFWIQAYGFFRRAQKLGDKALGNPKSSLAILTDPPELPSDFRCWLMDLKRWSVGIGKDRQIGIYVPQGVPTPLAGEKIVIFAMGEVHGKKVFAGCVYAPHVAIVRGVQE